MSRGVVSRSVVSRDVVSRGVLSYLRYLWICSSLYVSVTWCGVAGLDRCSCFPTPALSTPALSTPVSSCRLVHSRVVHPCFFVLRCPLLRCPALFHRADLSTPTLSTLAFSAPPLHRQKLSVKVSPLIFAKVSVSSILSAARISIDIGDNICKYR